MTEKLPRITAYAAIRHWKRLGLPLPGRAGAIRFTKIEKGKE